MALEIFLFFMLMPALIYLSIVGLLMYVCTRCWNRVVGLCIGLMGAIYILFEIVNESSRCGVGYLAALYRGGEGLPCDSLERVMAHSFVWYTAPVVFTGCLMLCLIFWRWRLARFS